MTPSILSVTTYYMTITKLSSADNKQIGGTRKSEGDHVTRSPQARVLEAGHNDRMLTSTRQLSVFSSTFVRAVRSLITMNSLLLLSSTALIWLAEAAFKCPPQDGLYEDPIQCDKYYECVDGEAVEKLCPDGLVFDPSIRKVNKCDQPFSVDCGDRLELQPPKSNHLCPRRNGYFAHPDETVCNIFYNCIEGEATEIVCPTGLHFDEYSGTCVWPDAAGRTGCGNKEAKLKDGFSCPKEIQTDSRGQAVAHPMYAHPEDCQKFYVCLNGVTPREQGCSLGQVYNEETGKCDEPENVPGCEDWYKDDPAIQNAKFDEKLRQAAASNRAKFRQ